MFNLHSVNMFFAIFVIFISTYTAVLCDCEDSETGPIYSSYDDAPLVYREFPANYSVRPYCPKGQQITETLMMPTCNAKNVPLYPLPDCARRYNGTINAAINGTKLVIILDQLIIPSSVQVYSIFDSIAVPVQKYNEVPSVGYTGYAINDEIYTHTSYVSIGRTKPVNKLTGEFVSGFCSNQSECTDRFDVDKVTIWHLPCGEQNPLYVNISTGLDFHKGIFAYKNVTTTQWTFDVNSCNMMKCTDVGIDSDTKFCPQVDDNIKRAKNGTIAICDADYIKAKMNCINGNWLGVISKPLIMC